MALNPNESAAFGMYKAVKDSESIFGPTNKSDRSPIGAISEERDEYESTMSNSEILELVGTWQRDFAPYYREIEPSQKKAFSYWLGKQVGDDLTARSTTSDPKPLVDNIIFEAVETFLPLATSANPDPVVSADPTDQGNRVAHALHASLVYEADRQLLKRKLARLVRNWSWDRLGVLKLSWNYVLQEIDTDVIRAKDMIFDKDGYIDEGGVFRGEYIGHKKKFAASRLIEMFPKREQDILRECEGRTGTKLEWIEWWYRGTDVFFTLGDHTVLGKYKNPNWNYDFGEGENIQKGINFHKEPMFPFVFFSIFSSGEHPYDETSLILQTVQLQDIVNKRIRQIDKNVEQMNNGMLLSGKAFTADQAAGAATALAKGQAILVPDGDVTRSAMRFAPNGLPETVFGQLTDMRGEIMNIYGTAGSTPQGIKDEKQVRGKIMVQQSDTSRIGGTITAQLEQVADSIYEWWVQLMFVFYDEEHFITTAGLQGGRELIQLKNTMFTGLKVIDITVKEGSLIPKDPITQRNEAMDLWSANAIDPLNFYKRLDVPDPAQMTQGLILWQMLQKGQIPPNMYLPSFQLPASPTSLPTEQPGTGGPAVNPSVPVQDLAPQSPVPGSPPAVEAQSRQLIQQIPIS